MRIRNQTSRRNTTKYIYLDTSKCKACWKCVEACPNGVIGKINLLFHKHAKINQPDLCKGCRKCVNACQEKAITLHPINITRNSEATQ